MRRFWVHVHRYVNLSIMAFLVITGVTGALLAYNSELERAFAPQLFAAPRASPQLSLGELAERAQTLVAAARVGGVTLTETDQLSVSFVPNRDPTTGKPVPLGFNQFYMDPWSGMELGRRTRGDLTEGLVNLMPFFYLMHFSLVAGYWGEVVLGVVSLAWTIDCFIGLYLTLPIAAERFLGRWRQAWLVKTRASLYRVNFDLHRASGLWTWPLLFIFAWSSVMFDLRPAYEAVTRVVFDYRSPRDAFLALPRTRIDHPQLGWRDAEAAGKKLMDALAIASGFSVGEPLGLAYMPALGAYRYEVRSSLDLFERAPKGGSTYVLFNGDTGELIDFFAPTGQRTGNTIESWLYALHMSRVFGPVFQAVVCLIGLVVTALSVTELIIWLRKRRAR